MYFRGPASPLSNLFPFPFTYNDQEFHSVEQAYQYEKARIHKSHDTMRAVLNSRDGFGAKRAADRRITSVGLIPEWLCQRKDIMLTMLLHKYRQCPEYAAMIDHHSSFVEDTNSEYWGRGRDGRGENTLGKLHLQVRNSRRRVLIAGSLPDRDMAAAYDRIKNKLASIVDVMSVPGGSVASVRHRLSRHSLDKYDVIFIVIGSSDMSSRDTELLSQPEDLIRRVDRLKDSVIRRVPHAMVTVCH